MAGMEEGYGGLSARVQGAWWRGRKKRTRGMKGGAGGVGGSIRRNKRGIFAAVKWRGAEFSPVARACCHLGAIFVLPFPED